MKGRWALNLFPQRWSGRDLLKSRLFPRRASTIPPASWAGELMEKRFRALFVCGSCAVKYREGLRRWAYVRNADKVAQGNACDFCHAVSAYTPIWYTEEQRPPTLQHLADESRRYGIAGAPHLYDNRRLAWTR